MDRSAGPERLLDRPYRADHRGRLFHMLWPATRYLVTHLTAIVLSVLFFVFNRTTVIGREFVPRRRNTLLLSNHQSMIDSFLVGFGAYFGAATFRPYLIPWNPAAEENFFRNRFWAWMADQWKCIPVKAGRRDLKALNRMIRALRGGTMILFPEGTRSRDGEIGSGRPGAGLVILANHPTVIPVTIDGMRDVLPIGRVMPRFGKHVHVVFGPPVRYEEFIGRPRSKETAQEIVNKVMRVLCEQRDGVRKLRGGDITREEFRRWLSAKGED